VLDVVLVVDISGSSFEAVQFSRALSFGLHINTDAVRVGVVAFTYNVTHVIPLDQFIRQQRNLIESINFPRRRGVTNIQVNDNIFGIDELINNYQLIYKYFDLSILCK